MDNQQLPTFWITGYLPNGVKISFTVPFTSDPYGEALLFTNTLLSRGFSINPISIDESNAIVITTVMRRAKSDGTPIIDFYPEWGFPVTGKETFGTFRSLGIYMNASEPQLVADFLAVSGFKSLEQIPLYDGQAPLKRDQARPHAKETKVPTPFKIVREQGEEKMGSDGKLYRSWQLVRYEAINGATPPPQSNDAPATTKSQPAEDRDVQWMTDKDIVKQLVSAISTQSGLSATDILGAVNIVTGQPAARWSELKNVTRSDCWAAVLLSEHKFNKTVALNAVGNDANKVKAIEYWANKTEQIDF